MALPQPGRGQARRQRVDRHDPAGVEDLRLAGQDLELGVVEGQLAPEVLDLAGHDDLAADRQPTLDEAPPEPRRVDRCRCRPRAARSCAGSGPGSRARRGRRRRSPGPRRPTPSCSMYRSRIVPHLAQVVVAAREVEEEVADRVEVEADAGATQLGAGGQPRLRERRRRAARWGRSAAAVAGGAFRAVAVRAIARPIPPRSGTGRRAGHRAGPRSRRRSATAPILRAIASASARSAPSP